MPRMLCVLLIVAACLAPTVVLGYASYETSTSVWDLQQQLSPITLDSNLMYVSGTGVRISGSATSGVAGFYNTDAPLPTDWAVGSWNVDMPSGTGIRIEVRAVNGTNSTSWFEIARQGTIPSGITAIKGTTRNGISQDTLILSKTWPRLEYRVTLYTNTVGVTPTLRLMSLCYADTGTLIPYVELANPSSETSLDAPWRSQYWSSVAPDSICGPTSMSMAMAYNGCNLATETVANEAYDDVNGIYGNWPFLAQEAARHGFKSYYGRANGQQPLRDFFAQGVPVEFAMAYNAGELTNSPISSTGGHLVLCVGVTTNGDYICNDPAGSSATWDHVVYLKDEIAHVWLENGSATMIPCIPSSVYWRFPYYPYKSTDPISTNKNGVIELFANGIDGHMYRIKQTGPNAGWTGWTAMGGTPVTDPVAVTNRTGGNSVFAKFADGYLYYSAQNGPSGAWSGWINLGTVAGKPSVGKSPDGRLDVYCRMADGTIQHRWEDYVGGWQAWASVGSNTFPADPVVGLNWEGREEIFVRGSDNQLYHSWQLNNGTFSSWASLGGTVAGQPSIGKLSDGRLEVYCRFTDGTVRHIWQSTQFVGTAWGSWTSYTGTTTSNVVAARTPAFLQNVFCGAAGGSVNFAYQSGVDGGWSLWQSLGGAGLGDPIVGHNEDGRLQAFLFEADGKLWSRWQLTTGGWSGWTAMGSVLFRETVPPVISSVTVSPSFVAKGDIVSVTATVTDNASVLGVTANGMPLTSDGAGHWSASIAAAGDPSWDPITIPVSVVATDTSGNTATDSSKSYTVAHVFALSNRAAHDATAAALQSRLMFLVYGTVNDATTDQFTLDDGSENPIVVVAPGHGLTAGARVKVYGALLSGQIQTTAACITPME